MNDALIESLEAKLKMDPASRVFLRLAEEYRKGEVFDRAIEVCDHGLSHHPDHVPAMVCRGRCFWSQGRKGETLASFRQVLDLAPDNIHALRALAEIAVLDGNDSEALAYYENLVLLDPEGDAQEWIDKLRQRMMESTTPSTPSDAAQDAPVSSPASSSEGEEDAYEEDEILFVEPPEPDPALSSELIVDDDTDREWSTVDADALKTSEVEFPGRQPAVVFPSDEEVGEEEISEVTSVQADRVEVHEVPEPGIYASLERDPEVVFAEDLSPEAVPDDDVSAGSSVNMEDVVEMVESPTMAVSDEEEMIPEEAAESASSTEESPFSSFSDRQLTETLDEGLTEPLFSVEAIDGGHASEPMAAPEALDMSQAREERVMSETQSMIQARRYEDALRLLGEAAQRRPDHSGIKFRLEQVQKILKQEPLTARKSRTLRNWLSQLKAAHHVSSHH